MSTRNQLAIPLELIEQLQRGNVVPLCGAGISASEGGLPASQQLAQELANRSGQGDISGLTLPAVAQAYELVLGHQSLIAYLASRIDDPRLVPLPAHQLIAALPFKSIITTNWDNLLEEALRPARKPYVKVVRDTDVAFADDNKVILVKLHGSIEQKDSIIITGDDYYDILAHLPETANLIRSYFATRTLLFLGYGLADDDFKRLYLEVVRNLGRHKRRAYAVQLNPTPLTIKYWQEKNVEVIAADAADFLETLKGHLDLAEPPVPLSGAMKTGDSAKKSMSDKEHPRIRQEIIKILFLAANPTDTMHLRLDEEIRAIDQALRQSEFRDHFDLRQHWAVRVTDLQGLLLRYNPVIVHFSGHGGQASEICLEDELGHSHPVSVRALSELFSVLKDNIRCVVLNACYSEKQAQAIAQHIDCVVGMSRAITDESSIRFAAAFYQALGFGRSVKTAFDLGCSQIDLENLAEQDTPQLLALKGDPKQIVFMQEE